MGHALGVDLGQHEGRGVRGGDDETRAHAIGLQAPEQQPSEPVVRDAAQEVHVAAEAGDGARRVVLAAAGRRDDAASLVDDEVDEGLTPDDDTGPGWDSGGLRPGSLR